MANIKSAAKRARQDVARRARNSSVLSGLKSGQRKLRAAIAAGKLDVAKSEYVKVSSALPVQKVGGRVYFASLASMILQEAT